MQRDFPQYAWSVTTLNRRLAHFEINNIDATVTVGLVEVSFMAEEQQALQEEPQPQQAS